MFEVCLGITGGGYRGTLGDSYARYMVRIGEMQESARLVRQAVEGLPGAASDAEVLADHDRH